MKKYQVTIPGVYLDAVQKIEDFPSWAEDVVRENIDRVADIEGDVIPRWVSGDPTRVYLYFTPDVVAKLTGIDKPSRKIRSLLLEHMGLSINGYGPNPGKPIKRKRKQSDKLRDEFYQEKPVSGNGKKLVRILLTQEHFDRLRVAWGNYPQNEVAEYVNANALKLRNFGAIVMPRGKATPENLSAVTIWVDDAVYEHLQRGKSFVSEKIRWMLFEAEGAPA